MLVLTASIDCIHALPAAAPALPREPSTSGGGAAAASAPPVYKSPASEPPTTTGVEYRSIDLLSRL